MLFFTTKDITLKQNEKKNLPIIHFIFFNLLNAWLIQKYTDSSIRACSRYLCHVTEGIHAVLSVCSGWLYRGSRCADTLCIVFTDLTPILFSFLFSFGVAYYNHMIRSFFLACFFI